MKLHAFILGAVAAMAAGTAQAQEIHFGATLSTTGPGASLGIPIKNTFQIMPAEIAGVPVRWTILDDATDTTAARRNAEKLSEEGVDLMIGGSTTPTALATVEVAGRTKTPSLAIAPSPALIEPMDESRKWVFKVPLGERALAGRTIRDMSGRRIANFGFIGFNDAFGEGWLKEFARLGPEYGITMTTTERFARTDNSVTAQVLKVLSTRPEAVFIAATGTPAALPLLALRERGFTGPVYLTSGVINNDFLRVGGKAAEGALLASGPLVVAAELPDSNPTKQVSLDFVRAYEDAYGAGTVSLFAGNAHDAWLLAEHAVTEALKTQKPGTVEFRAAVRDALESTTDLPVSGGVVTFRRRLHVMSKVRSTWISSMALDVMRTPSRISR